MKTAYNQIVDSHAIASRKSKVDIQHIINLGKTEISIPSTEDQKKTLLLAIDVQNDFMEDIGSLPVAGSRQDVTNLTNWIYNNLNKLTNIICSLDTHSIGQIFHAEWWKDPKGNAPTPFTIISYKDVKEGKWMAKNGEQERTLDYLKNLEANGQKQLCIWPYHCLEGTFGAQLEAEFIKMLYFHATVRATAPIFIPKGQNPYSEMYGIIKAEYDPENNSNVELLNKIATYDEIYIAGEASSHCVLASLEQILEYFEDNVDLTSRITILSDCMSPIVGFEETTNNRLEQLKEKYAIQIRKSTEVIL